VHRLGDESMAVSRSQTSGCEIWSSRLGAVNAALLAAGAQGLQTHGVDDESMRPSQQQMAGGGSYQREKGEGAAGASGKIRSDNDGLVSTRRGRAWRPGG
jgi:hypothetical protein